MIVGKIWKSFMSQLNKIANAIRGYDPVAEMRYEYDKSVEELKNGREGRLWSNPFPAGWRRRTAS